MAKEKETKITLERTYNIPLRRKFQLAPRYKRANRAVKAVREFLQKHMKSDDVKLGYYLNLKLWERGIRNPPHHVKINAIKDDKGVVRAEIVGKEIQLEQEKKEKKEEGMAEKLGLKKEEEQPETKTYKPQTEESVEQDEKAEEKVTEETKKEAEKTPETEKQDEKTTETKKAEETTGPSKSTEKQAEKTTETKTEETSEPSTETTEKQEEQTTETKKTSQ